VTKLCASVSNSRGTSRKRRVLHHPTTHHHIYTLACLVIDDDSPVKVAFAMLPSRLYRCIGIPPPLRSLMVIHPALPPSVAIQLRLRLQLLPRTLTSSATPHASSSSQPKVNSADAESHLRHREHSQSSPNTSASLPPARSPDHEEPQAAQEPRLQLTFTCTVSNCSERSTHTFTKRAYERGIVLVQCPKCKNRYAISVDWSIAMY
jgi:protein import protein ZIM17